MADGAGAVGAPPTRIGVRVTGAVQGVGFRPYVYRLATELCLTGLVRNDSEGVWIELEGPRAREFLRRIGPEAPPLARIDSVRVIDLPPAGDMAFRVEESLSGVASTRIPPDAGICRDCVAELFDPANRRYLYPFIACCNCGPRFTMTRSLPYDRPQTAMAAFPLCASCASDYGAPANRRFHAEPTACAACGPTYNTPPDDVFRRLNQGEIVAVKGVGGYHLMCDARNTEAVALLRQRKERSGKPFAVLAANLASVGRWAHVSSEEADALTSPARPIVLLKSRNNSLDHLAPGLGQIGVMLPSTGLHWLLFHEALRRPEGLSWTGEALDALFLCTSANQAGEPLAVDAGSARSSLVSIADAFVDHDREILVRADDPVVRLVRGAPTLLRRGRGQTPEPIQLPHAIPPTLALGGHLKAAVCVTRGDQAFLAQHVGDLDDPDTLKFHQETAAHLLSILQVQPEIVACDLHPDFASTRAAFASGRPVAQIQHHAAHAAACLAEHQLTGPALALTLDGYGYGDGGEAWGGELLLCQGTRIRRIGGLRSLPFVGGDRAAREPWRMAAAVLADLGRHNAIPVRFAEQAQSAALAALLQRPAARTSSAGRYFDAAAGLLGICLVQGYEAEAAMRMEALARPVAAQGLWRMSGSELDLSDMFACLADMGPAEGASLFHAELADGLAALAAREAAAYDITDVVLTGGCLANALLAETLCALLTQHKLRPHLHRYAPPGDGGLALGQAWLAGLQAATTGR